MTKSDREEEARAALKRLDQQSEKIITGSHPHDPPEDDKIEILGKRIARILSVILMVGLIIYLWRTYLNG
ncbi:hypothetical protein [Taklimakanibacter deserti]|uniref:hypothetical protein n=1 Tax=Taklimakanibacter deserti TaxID=2267839 RepID=UPI000E649AA8